MCATNSEHVYVCLQKHFEQILCIQCKEQELKSMARNEMAHVGGFSCLMLILKHSNVTKAIFLSK